MKLDLNVQEASLLKKQIDRRLEELELELVHTDKRELQRALAKDGELLRSIEERLTRVIASSSAEASEDVV